MKKRYILFFLTILAAVSVLAACTPGVRIEDAPPTLPIAAAATAAPAMTTPTGQASGPAATLPALTSPAATSPQTNETRPAGTVASHAGTPVVVLESHEIVPIPVTLLHDLNKTLDELLESVSQLEAPDEDVLAFP